MSVTRQLIRVRQPYLVAGFVLLAACTGGAPESTGSPPAATSEATDPAATSEATPASTARTTATPAAPTPAPVTAWEVLVFTNPEMPSGIGGILQQGDRLIAVGSAGGAGAAWTQEPGGEWTPATEVPPPPPDDETFGLGNVVDGPAGLVAIGGLAHLEPSGSAIWTSVDGAAWTEVQQFDDSLYSVAANDAGYVAVGSGTSVANPTPIVVWTSPDGVTWTQADTEALGLGHMSDVIARDEGFLAVGTLQGSGSGGQTLPARAAAWTSPDGMTWTEVWAETTENTFISSVVETDAGLVAVGQIHEESEEPTGPGTRVPTAWQSTDGTDWQATPFESPPGTVTGIAVGEDGFVAVGWLGGQEEEMLLAVWTSPDAGTWTLVEELTQEPPGTLQDVILLPDRVVAVGALSGDDPNREERQAIVVTGPLP